jgi:hypothetical protein
MFTLFYIFILESNIKKYKDEKSLQETGIVLLVSDGIAINSFLKKIKNNILNIFSFLFLNREVLLFNIKIKIIQIIQTLLFVRLFLLFTYCLLNFIFLLATILFNFEYNIVFNFIFDIIENIKNSQVVYCMEEDIEMSSSEEEQRSSFNSSDSDLAYMDPQYRYCVEVLRNPEEYSQYVDTLLSNELYPFIYFSGAPFIGGILNLNLVCNKILNENINMIDNLETIFSVIDYFNLPDSEITERYLTKSQYLSIFSETIEYIDTIINLKYSSNVKIINLYLAKLAEHRDNVNFGDIYHSIFPQQLIKIKELTDLISQFTNASHSINSFLNKDLNMIYYLSSVKDLLTDNCSLINRTIRDDSVDFIVNNQIPLNFELPEFNSEHLRYPSLNILLESYQDSLIENNFQPDYYYNFRVRIDRNFLIENGFQLEN